MQLEMVGQGSHQTVSEPTEPENTGAVRQLGNKSKGEGKESECGGPDSTADALSSEISMTSLVLANNSLTFFNNRTHAAFSAPYLFLIKVTYETAFRSLLFLQTYSYNIVFSEDTYCHVQRAYL